MRIDKGRMNRVATVLALLAGGLLLFAGAGSSPSSVNAAAKISSAVGGSTPQSVVLRVYFRSTAERDQLATEYGAEEVATTGGYLTMWTDQPTYASLVATHPGLRVEIDQRQTDLVNSASFGKDPNNPNTFYGGYKTVEEMQTFLNQYAATYPTLAQVVDIGDSWCKVNPGCTLPAPYNGYDILALHITNQAIPGPKPVFWYEGAIHAREIAVSEVAMRYISLLLDGYQNDADAHWLVDYHDIWVVPSLNPDGHHIVEAGGGGSSPYYQRKNSNNTNGCTVWPPTAGTQFGVDNNRNFPFLWNCCGGSSGAACSQTYHGVSGNSDPETQASVNQIRLLFPDQRGPNNTDPAPITSTGVFQDMHSNASLNLYPWGWTGTASPNGPELAVLGQHLRATNAYPPGNNYQSCQPPNCLYAVDGDAIDQAYGDLGVAAFTTEVGGADFLVPLSYVDGTLWPANRGPLIYEAKIVRTPYLLSHGPDASSVATNPMTVTQGSPSQLTGTINFAWSGNSFAQNVGAAEYYLDTPPWAGGTGIPMNGTFGGSQTVPVNATIDTTSIPVGTHVIFVRGRGVNQFQGYDTWGPFTATWLVVQPSGGNTPTPLPATPTQPPAPSPTSTAPPAPSATGTVLVQASATNTVEPQPSATVPPVASATNTVGTPGATSTPQATATPCTLSFSDVHSTDFFYTPVLYLACHGVVSGYADGTFRPYNNTTRGQMAKIISNAVGYNDEIPPDQQTYEDVPPTHTFWLYIERITLHHAAAGYPCGEPSEPCGPENRPYFRPFANITRGQLSKIVVIAMGWPLVSTPAPGTFEDVPPSNVFYTYIETAYCHGVISGYECGGAGEPCDPTNRPYFRWYNDATRGQIAKIVYLSITSTTSCAAAR
jgi:carboxypeptidase T